MMLFGFGRVPGCLGLGALFLWDEWREGRTDRLPAGRLQGLSFFVVCWEMVWHRRCVGCGCGEFFAICREGIGDRGCFG